MLNRLSIRDVSIPIIACYTATMRRTDPGTKAYARRRDRLVRNSKQWYVQTREGVRGPFLHRIAATKEISRYVETMQFLEENKPTLPPDINWNDVTLVEMSRAPSPLKKPVLGLAYDNTRDNKR